MRWEAEWQGKPFTIHGGQSRFYVEYSDTLKISNRGIMILTLMSKGMAQKEVARRLGISYDTVKNEIFYLKSIMNETRGKTIQHVVQAEQLQLLFPITQIGIERIVRSNGHSTQAEEHTSDPVTVFSRK